MTVAAAEAKANPRAVITTPVMSSPATTVTAQAPAPAGPGLLDGGKNLMSNLFSKVSGDSAPAIKVYEPAQPIPADAPLPPRRAASADAPVRMASVVKAKPDALDAADAPVAH